MTGRRRAAVTSEPAGPRSPDTWRQDELVEELAQLIRVDVVADVALRAFAEDLLVDAGAVRALVQVKVLARPDGLGGRLDALEGMRARERGATSSAISMLDRHERVALGSEPVPTPTVSESRFDWNDFGIGTGVGIAFMLAVAGLGAGVLAIRHGQKRAASA